MDILNYLHFLINMKISKWRHWQIMHFIASSFTKEGTSVWICRQEPPGRRFLQYTNKKEALWTLKMCWLLTSSNRVVTLDMLSQSQVYIIVTTPGKEGVKRGINQQALPSYTIADVFQIHLMSYSRDFNIKKSVTAFCLF